MLKLKRFLGENGISVGIRVEYGLSARLLKEIHDRIFRKVKERSDYYDEFFKDVLRKAMTDEDLEIVGLYWFLRILMTNYVKMLNSNEGRDVDKMSDVEWEDEVMGRLSDYEEWQRMVEFGVHCLLELAMQLCDKEWDFERIESVDGTQA